MPPPPLFTHTTWMSAPARPAASRPPASCTSATSPISTQVGAPGGQRGAGGGGHHAVDAVGAAVGQEADVGVCVTGKNDSTSRTGIDELTQTCAPSGSSSASAA